MCLGHSKLFPRIQKKRVESHPIDRGKRNRAVPLTYLHKCGGGAGKGETAGGVQQTYFCASNQPRKPFTESYSVH